MAKHKVDETLFKSCKVFLKDGWETKDIAEALHISDVTVGRIRRCLTYDEYKALIGSHHPVIIRENQSDVEKETVEICGLVIEISIKRRC